MTVAQLIAELSKLPGELPVNLAIGDHPAGYGFLENLTEGQLFEANHVGEGDKEWVELCAGRVGK